MNVGNGANAEYNEGYLTMTGGTLTCTGTLYVPNHSSDAQLISKGSVAFYGGLMAVTNFSMGNGKTGVNGGKGSFDMRQGATLIVSGDKRSVIQGYVASNWFTAYGGAGTVYINYNTVNPGKTTVTAAPPVSLSAPVYTSPLHAGTVPYKDAWLQWDKVFGATRYDVYVGSSSNAVLAATTSSPEYKGTSERAAYSATGLDGNQGVYFWRVDAVTDSIVKPGPVWKFMLEHLPQVTNPAPHDGEEYVVSGSAAMSWSNAAGAVNSEVVKLQTVRGWAEFCGEPLRIQVNRLSCCHGLFLLFLYRVVFF